MRSKPSTILKAEHYLAIRDLLNTLEEIRGLQARVEKLRKILAPVCPHPQGSVVVWKWEHDDGYGRQRMIEGRRCELCRALDHWGRGSWVRPKDCEY